MPGLGWLKNQIASHPAMPSLTQGINHATSRANLEAWMDAWSHRGGEGVVS